MNFGDTPGNSVEGDDDDPTMLMHPASLTESKQNRYIVLDEVVEPLREMPESLQKQVLGFARTLSDSTVQGVSGF